MRILSIVLASYFGVLGLSGCATMMNEREQSVVIKSNIEGADVYFNGDLIGRTPLTTNLPRGNETHVTLKKDGYKSVQSELETHFSNNFWWNLPLTVVGTTGGTVDYINGTAFEYSQGEYLIEMTKDTTSLEEARALHKKFAQLLLENYGRNQLANATSRHSPSEWSHADDSL